MNVLSYFEKDIVNIIKDKILELDGQDIFFEGLINSNGKIVSLEPDSLEPNIEIDKKKVPANIIHKKEASVIIHNHSSGRLKPYKYELASVENITENAQGYYIINNDVSDICVVAEPVKPKSIVKIDEDVAGGYISKGGALDRLSEGFEERAVQVKLLKSIAKAFNENKLAVFEAGTGVGKSYSYLIPSVLWALNNNERVIISTGTINLQHQLCEKDIPMVERILGRKINYLLMKGRQNYICRRRLADASSVLDLFENVDELNKIAKWAENTKTGSKSELPFMPSENNWLKVNSESDACMGTRCPFRNECFVMKIRKEAFNSNLIIVNHHLLFADIESRINGAGYDDTVVLPPYRRVVFDEAHGIENAATSFFSESVNRFKLTKLINLLYKKKKKIASGYLCSLAVLSSNEDKAENIDELISTIKTILLNMDVAAKDLLRNDITVRLCTKSSRDFGPLLVFVSELTKSLSSLTELLENIIDGIDEDDSDIPAYWESKTILKRLELYILLFKDFSLWDNNKDKVFWIQKKRLPNDMIKESADGDYINFNKTPLNISKIMSEGVFENMNSVICTSATLKTGEDFNFWINRTGLNFIDSNRVVTGCFNSPFPYKTNMLFAVPKDAPFPDNSGFQQYVEMAIPRLIKAAKGRTLVLFTSYESLKSAYNCTKQILKGFSGRIMKQGEDDSRKLLDVFRTEKESVLFATDSFWQGVDVPGDSLSQVIIVKLPFTVPNDPVFVARAEAIEMNGGNAFMELSVPEAIIKFRQGIGRLIRRSDDKGSVVVLDRRIFEKRYGSKFVASMPDCKKLYEPLEIIIRKINSFIFD